MPRCAAKARAPVQKPIMEQWDSYLTVWYFSDESLQYVKAFLMAPWSPKGLLI